MATKKPTTKKPAATKAPVKKPTAAKTTKKPVADGNVGVTHKKVQLWEDGPYWATTNIGAEKPEDFGYYFWWGDTVGYRRENGAWVAIDGSSDDFSFERSNTPTAFAIFNDDDDDDCDDDDDNDVGFARLEGEGWITSEGVLSPEHDAAHVQWGDGWRMPTQEELKKLVEKCVWTWKKVKGVDGFVVRGRGKYASASIFLPAAADGCETYFISAGYVGHYWSSVPRSSKYDHAWSLFFNDAKKIDAADFSSRERGLAIRPVQGFTK